MITGGRYPLYLKVRNKGKTPLINIPRGTADNTVKLLPRNYKSADLEIISDDNSIIKHGEKIRVTGEMTNVSKAYCNLQVEKIEKP